MGIGGQKSFSVKIPKYTTITNRIFCKGTHYKLLNNYFFRTKNH